MLHLMMLGAVLYVVWISSQLYRYTDLLGTYLQLMTVPGIQAQLDEGVLSNGHLAIEEYSRWRFLGMPIMAGVVLNLLVMWGMFVFGIEVASIYLAFVAMTTAAGLMLYYKHDFEQIWMSSWTDRVAIAYTQQTINEMTDRLVEIGEIMEATETLTPVRKTALDCEAQGLIKAVLALKSHLLDLKSRSTEIDLD